MTTRKLETLDVNRTDTDYTERIQMALTRCLDIAPGIVPAADKAIAERAAIVAELEEFEADAGRWLRSDWLDAAQRREERMALAEIEERGDVDASRTPEPVRAHTERPRAIARANALMSRLHIADRKVRSAATANASKMLGAHVESVDALGAEWVELAWKAERAREAYQAALEHTYRLVDFSEGRTRARDPYFARKRRDRVLAVVQKVPGEAMRDGSALVRRLVNGHEFIELVDEPKADDE